MPRYFFDVHDGGVSRDEIGTDYADLEAVRDAARRLLPDVARDETRRDGDRHTFTVVVTDEDGKAIYSGTLNFTGLWLIR